MKRFRNNTKSEDWVAGELREIENHIFDSAYDWMIPLELSFNSLMDAKHKIERNLLEINAMSRLGKKDDANGPRSELLYSFVPFHCLQISSLKFSRNGLPPVKC